MHLLASSRLASLALVALAAAGACNEHNPNYCEAGTLCTDASIDSIEGCNANPNICTGTDTTCLNNFCVDCAPGDEQESVAQCDVAGAPVCGTDNRCRACAEDSECASDFCNDGTCIPTADVIYIKRNELDIGTCTQADECGSPIFGMALVTATRKYMHVEANADPYVLPAALIITQPVVIHAMGAIFERPSGNQIIDVTGGSSTIVGVTVRDAAGGGGADGIRCVDATLTLRSVTATGSDDRGIDAANCVLDINRSELSDNTEGGLRVIDGRFSLTNSYVFGNGDNASAAGGLSLNPNATPNVLELNTIVKNTGSTSNGSAGGVVCSGTSLITARNNVIYGSLTTNVEVEGTNCPHTHSVIGPMNTPIGTMVRTLTVIELAFVNFATGDDVGDFHIGAASLLRNSAAPASTAGNTAVDFDGEARPNPSPMNADIGADEIP